jgi:serine/threonine-protein kinase
LQNDADLDAILLGVLERAPKERGPFLDVVCAENAAARESVECLLRELDDADPFILPGGALLGAFGEDFAEALAQDEGLPLGEAVGPYRLVGELGRGGMAVVYLAERADGEFSQEVALKVLKRGMGADDALLRFRQERQILASLEHPGIARLLDGGVTADGRPYLAMERIDGEPIDRYCERMALDVDARVDLLIGVARVVQYAHRRLVVHRDLKPGNVFVTAEGEIKLLDFGIAKLLDPAAVDHAIPPTRSALRVMTPQYASPEQVRGEPVTTASDVYQLGLILFELLAGRRAQPMDGLGPAEAERVVCEHEPARPSAVVVGSRRLQRKLRGDLDNIVLRALAKAPERRYGSVEQLVDDLVRYRRGLPVTARGESLRYRASKLLRRHRLAAAAAAMILLLVGAIVAFYSLRLGSERDRARREAATASQVADFLVELFEASDPTRPRDAAAVTARELLDRGAERLRGQLAGEPEIQEELMTVVGRIYTRLGLYDQARELVGPALERREARSGSEAELAESLEASAWIDYWTGRFGDARAQAERALALRSEAFGPEHLDMATLHHLLGRIHRRTADYESARTHLTRALEIRQRHLPPDDLEIAAVFAGLGSLAYQMGDSDGAVDYHQRALQVYESKLSEDDVRIASAIGNLAQVRMDREEYDGLEPLLLRARDIFQLRYGPDHREVGTAWLTLGALYYETGRYADAAAAFERSLSTYERTVGSRHLFVSYALHSLGNVYRKLGKPSKAVPLYERAVSIRHESLGERNPLALEPMPSLGLALVEAGKAEQAEPLLRNALETARQVFPQADPRLGEILVALGSGLIESGSAAEAELILREAIQILQGAEVALADAESALAASLLAQGERDEAERMLLASLQILREGGDQSARVTARRLVHLYESAGSGQAAGQRAFLARIDREADAELARIEAATALAQ